MVSGLGGCGGSGSAEPPAVHHQDGVTYSLPAGWHVASRSLTPHLVNPREVFTAGTGRLVAQDGRCAQMPSAALAAMTPGDVLVTVQERFGSEQGFPARPQRFALVAQRSEAETCAGPHPAFVSHWSEFRDNGRAFHVLVAVGQERFPRARERRARAAWTRCGSSAAFTPRASQPRRAGARASAAPRARAAACTGSARRGHRPCRSATAPRTSPAHDDRGAASGRHHHRGDAMVGVPAPARAPRPQSAAVAPRRRADAVPGPRGDELPLYRRRPLPRSLQRRRLGLLRRRNPTSAQRAAAERELAGASSAGRL